jgi:cytochrome c2
VFGARKSQNVKSADVTRDEGTLNKFLQDPGAFIRETRMSYNVTNATDRQNVIAYLKTLKN